MHRLLVQGDSRLLKALTQGLHGRLAHRCWLRGETGPKIAGDSGPNSTTTSIGVRLA